MQFQWNFLGLILTTARVAYGEPLGTNPLLSDWSEPVESLPKSISSA